MSWSRDVFSSMIQAVGWDDDSNELIVEFKNGVAWGYSGADEAFADQLSKAASVGGMFNTEVKNQLAGRRIR
jgi:KTSC domain